MSSESQALRLRGDMPAAAYGIVSSAGSEVLAQIRDPSVGLALWYRRLPAGLAAWLAALLQQQLPEGRVLVQLDDVDAAVDSIFTASRTPRCTMSEALAADVIDLAARFAYLAESDMVDLRLEVVEHDACWKFHRDSVRLRLLTTYFGPVTQIVDATNARSALRMQRDYRGPYLSISPHTVAFFRGDLDGQGAGLVHRSPPLDGTGQHRLVLCLNLPSLASPEGWEPGGFLP